MQVKKVTFQRMKSGGRGRTENRWDVSGAGELHHRKYIFYIHGKYIKKSRRLTVRTTTDLFLVTLQSAVLQARFLLYTYQRVPHLHYLSEHGGQRLTYNWRFLLIDIAFVEGCRCFKKRFPPKNLEYKFICYIYSWPHNSSGSSKIILSTRPSWSSG